MALIIVYVWLKVVSAIMRITFLQATRVCPPEWFLLEEWQTEDSFKQNISNSASNVLFQLFISWLCLLSLFINSRLIFEYALLLVNGQLLLVLLQKDDSTYSSFAKRRNFFGKILALILHSLFYF